MEAASRHQMKSARTAFEKCKDQGRRLAATLDESRWSAGSAAGGWSPAECFEHLNLTLSGMLPLLQAGVDEARKNQWRPLGPLSVGIVPRLLCWFLEPPYRVRTATQPAFVPAAVATKAQTLAAWDSWHNDLDDLILGSDGLALDRPMIVSPFDPKAKMRYSVYAGLLIVAAHERRHLWQASRLV